VLHLLCVPHLQSFFFFWFSLYFFYWHEQIVDNRWENTKMSTMSMPLKRKLSIPAMGGDSGLASKKVHTTSSFQPTAPQNS
jgi:hypothetical protein